MVKKDNLLKFLDELSLISGCKAREEVKRFYNRETISFIRISLLAESPSTFSRLVEMIKLRKELIV